jgi:hypothetical protein|tara:strand:+ start:1116 stop:1535 length:420 start_codon:yes stop_codon:yes gene_type:complete
MKITYSKKGSKTTTAISDAPYAVKAVWHKANSLGINIVRVRSAKERYEVTKGETFVGWHGGKTSLYKQRENPSKPLFFKRKIALGKENRGMQVLEISTDMDAQQTFDVIDDFEYNTSMTFFQRLVMNFNRLMTGKPLIS